jgi:hypothetical protein
LTNPTVQTAHVLDANGMNVRTIGLEQGNGVKQFKFPEDALYVVLK